MSYVAYCLQNYSCGCRLVSYRVIEEREFDEYSDFRYEKNADTRKAERYFKERGIKFQSVDMKEKGISKGELNSVLQAVGGLEELLDEKTKDQKAYLLIKYLAPEDKFEKVLENPMVLKQPIVRNGRQATVGYQPDVWKNWE